MPVRARGNNIDGAADELLEPVYVGPGLLGQLVHLSCTGGRVIPALMLLEYRLAVLQRGKTAREPLDYFALVFVCRADLDLVESVQNVQSRQHGR